MKYLITLLLLFSVFLTIAQNRIEDRYDYLSWNNLKEENIHYYHFQTIIRAYQNKESPYTKWEIIEQTDSNFIYLEYEDSCRSPSVIGNLLQVDSTRTDTIYTFHPETFVEQHIPINVVQHYFVKHGSWIIEGDGIYAHHHYLNDKKTGEAYISNNQNEIVSYKKLIYNDDSLVMQKELNFALTFNKDSIKRHFIGEWNFNFVEGYFKLNRNSSLNKYTFHENGTFDFQRKNRHLGIIQTMPNTHFWYINNDYHLVLEFPNNVVELKIVDAYINFYIFCKIINETLKD